MTKTQHYQLNQWDPEDRILRVEFNDDNAAIDAALKATADATAGEITNRKSADTKIRTDFAAADNTLRSEFAAADNAVRSEFAAADAVLRSENTVVKLASLTTTATATQVNISVSNIQQYSKLIIIPRLEVSDTNKIVLLRLNSVSSGYYADTTAKSYIGRCIPTGAATSRAPYYAEITLYPSGSRLAAWSSYNDEKGHIPSDALAADKVTTLNFVSSESGIKAGSKITVYGVKL